MTKITSFLLIVSAVFLFFSISPSVYSQPQDSVRYGILPSFSYDTDNGIYIAAELQRFDYNGGIVPFNSFGKYRASYKGMGAYTLALYHDQVRTFGTTKRSSVDILISKNYGDYYPGLTVEEGFSRHLLDTTSYYHFNSFMFNIGMETRIPFFEIRGLERTDLKLGFRVVHEQPVELQGTSHMAMQQPSGWRGSTYSFIEVGYIKENRDSEFRTEDGYLASLAFKGAVPFLSSSMIGQLYSEFRFFKELLNSGSSQQLVFAQRFQINQTMGDVPYWFAPSLGGNGTARGYIYRRFVGNGFVQSSTELRSWLFKLPWWNSQVGLNFFSDNGAVYNKRFTKWERATTFGAGGFMTLFSPDYILKCELGFSKEGMGVYIGSGFSF